MGERTGIVKFQGKPVTLLGPELKPGDQAPDFRLLEPDRRQVSLGDFGGKTKIICTIPSIDTPVCQAEIRRFNQEAARLSDDIVLLFVSLDPPVSLKKWCVSSRVERVKVLTAFQGRSFGVAYGVLIKELHRLTRAIFVVDGQNAIRYIQHVLEITEEPDYMAVLEAAREQIAVRQVPVDGICGAY